MMQGEFEKVKCIQPCYWTYAEISWVSCWLFEFLLPFLVIWCRSFTHQRLRVPEHGTQDGIAPTSAWAWRCLKCFSGGITRYYLILTLQEFIRIPEFINQESSLLNDICEQYAHLKFFSGVVELCLKCAKAVDPSDLCSGWLKDDREGDGRNYSALTHLQRRAKTSWTKDGSATHLFGEYWACLRQKRI